MKDIPADRPSPLTTKRIRRATEEQLARWRESYCYGSCNRSRIERELEQRQKEKSGGRQA